MCVDSGVVHVPRVAECADCVKKYSKKRSTWQAHTSNEAAASTPWQGDFVSRRTHHILNEQTIRQALRDMHKYERGAVAAA